LHIFDNAYISEREQFVLSKQCFSGRKVVDGEGGDMEASVFSDVIK